MLVKTTIKWPDGNVTERTINWNSNKQKQDFSNFETIALEKGAEVTTSKVNEGE